MENFFLFHGTVHHPNKYQTDSWNPSRVRAVTSFGTGGHIQWRRYPSAPKADDGKKRLGNLVTHKRERNLTTSIYKKTNLRDLIAATGLVISNWVQIVDFSARVILKFDRWPRTTIGHFFYITSSFVHHFKSIGEFKLELQSGNAQFGSKLSVFCPVWPWNLMDDLKKTIGHLSYLASSFAHHFIGEFKPESQSGNANLDPNLDQNRRFF